MATKRKKRTNTIEVGPFAGLYSRHIFRAVVEALELEEDHPLTDRTAQRFFRNSNANAYNQRQIFLALGQTLIDMGFVPDLGPHLTIEVPPSARVYADSIQSAAAFWDAFMSRIQSASSWEVDRVTAGRCFLGLASVDLALRLCTLNWIAGFDVQIPGVPLWAEENGIGKILRKPTQSAGLTRVHLAARVGVAKTSVDNWLDGRNWPDRSYIDSLAQVFTGGDPDRAGSLAAELRRQFALARLCDLLSELVGRDQVISAVEAVSEIAQGLTELKNLRFATDKERQEMGIHLLFHGCNSTLATDTLWRLAQNHPEGERKELILQAAWAWDIAFGQTLGTVENEPRASAAGLAEDYLEVVDGPERAHAEAARVVISAELNRNAATFMPRAPLTMSELHPLRGMDDAAEVRRRLVERFPNDSDAHAHLGSFLGMLGKNTGIRKFVDEGLFECRIASGLCPAWDMPAVEQGIMLANIGAYQEALEELERVAQDLPSLTPHWGFATGYVLAMLKRFAEGLEHLEEVTAFRSDYALAYRYAAHCAFNMGNHRKGAKYAKTAHRLGEPTEYVAWRRGKYRGKR
ncbi:MAG: hypothetical protein OXN21_03165 [Chloroflexota bacterium]|nr:hypothetical protein [Chloroflexota bacterium]